LETAPHSNGSPVHARPRRAPRLYDLAAHAAVLDSDELPAGHARLGHNGHGVNSWAMHYYLVQPALAILLQIAWGGIYTDNALAERGIAVAF
jgi:hypothetical protein